MSSGGGGWRAFGDLLKKILGHIRLFFRKLFGAIRHVAANRQQTTRGWVPGTRPCVLCTQPTPPRERCLNHPGAVCITCCDTHRLCDKDA